MSLIVEYMGNLPRMEFICGPEGTLLDIRFEIRAEVCMYQEPYWRQTDLMSLRVSYLGTLPSFYRAYGVLGQFTLPH